MRTTVRILTYGGRGRNVFRTLSALPFEVEILVVSKRPLYQIIAAKAIQLKALGLSLRTIAIQLNFDEKTIAKAIQWICKLDNRNSV